jgi:hypothetical protein
MTHPLAVLRRHRLHVAVILVNAVFATTFVAIALAGFHQPTPHGIPVGIVAPRPVARTIAARLDAHRPGAFALRVLPTEPRARLAIEHRRIDGAIIVLPRALDLLTAGAGGTAPTQAITAAATALAARTGRPVATTDVVPPGRNDSEGLSAFFVIMCALFPSLATGIIAGHALRRTSVASRVAVLGGIAVLAGLAAAALADGISGLGHYWTIAGVVALFSLAISAPTAALGQIRPHLAALSVLAFLVVGIPASGGPANLAGFGPGFLRALHAGLPLGIAADTVRNTVYFRAGDNTGHVWVLGAYAAGGLAALGLLVARRTRSAPSAPNIGMVWAASPSGTRR